MFNRIINWFKGEVSVDSLISTFHSTVQKLEDLAKKHEAAVEVAKADIVALEQKIETATNEIERAGVIAGNLKTLVGKA